MPCPQRPPSNFPDPAPPAEGGLSSFPKLLVHPLPCAQQLPSSPSLHLRLLAWWGVVPP